MKVTVLLVGEHRNIVQGLTLLAELGDLRASDFRAVAADLMVHLAAEERVVHPSIPESTGQHFGIGAAEHSEIRGAVLEALACGDDRAELRARIGAVLESFSAHAQRQEGALHYYLECTKTDRELRDLGLRVTAFRLATIGAQAISIDSRSAAE